MTLAKPSPQPVQLIRLALVTGVLMFGERDPVRRRLATYDTASSGSLIACEPPNER